MFVEKLPGSIELMLFSDKSLRKQHWKNNYSLFYDSLWQNYKVCSATNPSKSVDRIVVIKLLPISLWSNFT